MRSPTFHFAICATAAALFTACATGGAGPGSRDGGGPALVDAATGDLPDAAVVEDAGATDAGEGTVELDAAASPDAGAPDGGSGSDDSGAPEGCTTLPPTGSITLSGTTLGGPVWARPNDRASCPTTSHSTLATAVPHRAHVVCNPGGAARYDVALSGPIPDSFLVIYDGPVIPADTLQCLDIQDGSVSSMPSHAAIERLPVGAGQTLTVVVTGFRNSDAGPYTLTITRR